MTKVKEIMIVNEFFLGIFDSKIKQGKPSLASPV